MVRVALVLALAHATSALAASAASGPAASLHPQDVSIAASPEPSPEASPEASPGPVLPLASAVPVPTAAQKLIQLAAFVRDQSDNSAAIAGAKKVIAGSAGHAIKVVVFDEAELLLGSAEAAANSDLALTMEELMGEFQVSGKNVEEVKAGAYQGDMMTVNADQLAHFKNRSQTAKYLKAATVWYGMGDPWASGRIPYCYAAGIDSAAKDASEMAVAQIMKAVPCLTFVNVGLKTDGNGASSTDGGSAQCNEAPAVYVTSKFSGCWAYVGRLQAYATQGLNLQSNGCDFLGIAAHEWIHSLGMGHEQSRPDRDEYVSIDYTNIQAGTVHNFDLEPKGDANRAYDSLSLMHYGTHDFAVDTAKPVITMKDKAYHLYTTNSADFHKYLPGQRDGLTQLDADQTADMYNTINAGCTASTLLGKAACVDKAGTDGGTWNDAYLGGGGYDCDYYRTYVSDCSIYASSSFCCGCGDGGIRKHSWLSAAASPSSSPVTSSSPSPSSSPSSSPSPSPSTGTTVSAAVCFAKDSTTTCRILDAAATPEAAYGACYRGEGHGAAVRTPMAALQPGDAVLTASPRDGALATTWVMVNQHTTEDKLADVLTLHTAGGGSLSLTGDHALFVDGSLIAAADVKVGSVLTSGVVRRVAKAEGVAVVNAVTAAGTILVSDGEGAPALAASHPVWLASLVLDSVVVRFGVNAACAYVGDVPSVAHGVVLGLTKLAATLAVLAVAAKALRGRKL